MEKQVNFTDIMYAGVARTTRRKAFLEQMEKIVPFANWVKLIEPHYYKDNAGKKGRPPIGIEKMLRMYLVQVWYNLSDEMVEDSIIDSNALQNFVGIDLMSENVPDATTLLKFRHMLTENKLQQAMMAELKELLVKNNIMMTNGTIVDATIIQASSSTKNEKKERDSYAKSTKKGNNWYFGIKAHIGVCKKTGLVHTVKTTSANVSDVETGLELLHGKEQVVYGDSGYVGLDKREKAPQKVKFKITKRLSSINKITNPNKRKKEKKKETKKCSIRAKVEHAFHIIKNIFGYRKVKYKGEEKSDSLHNMLFACANLYKLARQGVGLPLIGNTG